MNRSLQYRFLGELPSEFVDTIQWLCTFKNALNVLISDVDRIVIRTVAFPVLYQLKNPSPSGYVVRHGHMKGNRSMITSINIVGTLDSKVKNTLDQLSETFDISQYHTPIVMELQYKKSYLGHVILLRSRAYQPISIESLRLVKSLAPFIEWICFGAGYRRIHRYPNELIRQALSRRLTVNARLSEVDTAILALLLSGFSYKATAEKMGMTMDAVKKHIKKIYNRAGVNSLSELWTRYYPERWDGLEEAKNS